MLMIAAFDRGDSANQFNSGWVGGEGWGMRRDVAESEGGGEGVWEGERGRIKGETESGRGREEKIEGERGQDSSVRERVI